jgi:hypothetical protein
MSALSNRLVWYHCQSSDSADIYWPSLLLPSTVKAYDLKGKLLSRDNSQAFVNALQGLPSYFVELLGYTESPIRLMSTPPVPMNYDSVGEYGVATDQRDQQFGMALAQLYSAAMKKASEIAMQNMAEDQEKLPNDNPTQAEQEAYTYQCKEEKKFPDAPSNTENGIQVVSAETENVDEPVNDNDETQMPAQEEGIVMEQVEDDTPINSPDDMEESIEEEDALLGTDVSAPPSPEVANDNLQPQRADAMMSKVPLADQIPFYPNLRLNKSDTLNIVKNKFRQLGCSFRLYGIDRREGVCFPGRSSSDGREGIDYLIGAEAFENYVREYYHWSPPIALSDLEGSSRKLNTVFEKMTPDRPTKPQDPAKPPEGTVQFSPEMPVAKNKTGKDRCKTVKIKSKAKITHEFSKTDSKSHKKATTNKGQATMRVSMSSTKQIKKSVDDKKRKSSVTSTAAKKPRQKDHNKLQIPRFAQVWPLLQKIGVEHYEVNNTYTLKNIEFRSSKGLRMFLCYYGIPDLRKIVEAKQGQLVKWVKFANVPSSSLDILSLNLPTNDKKIKELLTENGVETLDGKLYMPGAGRLVRVDRQVGMSFVFDDSQLRDQVVHFLRSSPSLNVESVALATTKYTPSTPYRTATDKAYLRVRAWAAMEDHPLPVFDKLPDNAERVLILCQEAEEDEIEESEEESVGEEKVMVEVIEKESVPKKGLKTLQPKQTTKKESADSPLWHKREPVPSFRNKVRSILKKLGYIESEGRWTLPEKAFTMMHAGADERYEFASISGLRKFMNRYGIPCVEDIVKESDKSTLDRWVRFANVPVHPHNSVRMLANLAKPTSMEQVQSMFRGMGFEFFDGKIFAPGANAIRRKMQKSAAKPHIFESGDKERLRQYARECIVLDAKLLTMPSGNEGEDELSHTEPVLTSEYLAFRLYGATDPKPLPLFTYLDGPDETPERLLMERWPLESYDADRINSSEGEVEQMESSEDDEASIAKSGIVHMDSVITEAFIANDKDRSDESPAVESFGSSMSATTISPESVKSDILLLRSRWGNDFVKGMPKFIYESMWKKTMVPECGFELRAGKYCHDWIAEGFPGCEDMRAYLCKHGLPNEENIKDSQAKADVLRWIRFAQVPKDKSTEMSLSDLFPMSSDEFYRVLVNNFKFQILDGTKVCPPGSDLLPGVRTNRVHHVHFWNKGHDFEAWFRARSSWYIGPTLIISGERTKRRNQDDKELELRMRLFAAMSKAPLPVFVAPVEEAAVADGDVEVCQEENVDMEDTVPFSPPCGVFEMQDQSLTESSAPTGIPSMIGNAEQATKMASRDEAVKQGLTSDDESLNGDEGTTFNNEENFASEETTIDIGIDCEGDREGENFDLLTQADAKDDVSVPGSDDAMELVDPSTNYLTQFDDDREDMTDGNA